MRQSVSISTLFSTVTLTSWMDTPEKSQSGHWWSGGEIKRCHLIATATVEIHIHIYEVSNKVSDN